MVRRSSLYPFGAFLTRVSSHVEFSPNSKFVLVSTQDSTIRLWNYQTSRCVKTYSGHVNRTYCLFSCFSRTKHRYIVSGSEDHKAYIWDLQTRQVLQTLEGHRGESKPFCASAIVTQLLLTLDVVLAVAVRDITSPAKAAVNFFTYTAGTSHKRHNRNFVHGEGLGYQTLVSQR